MKHIVNKSITPVDEYEWTLSNEVKEIAEKELRETEVIRNQALSAIREWVATNPRIKKMRLDSNYLLRFLRVKKFSVHLARDTMERYLLLRLAHEGKIFQNLDITDPTINELLDLGLVFTLPKHDKHGRKVIFIRAGIFDPVKYTNLTLLKIITVIVETLLENEENQIRGLTYIVDSAGIGLSHLTLFTPKETVRLAKNGEYAVPLRHKECIAFNIHPAIKYVVDFGMSLISEKMQKRVKIYTTMKEIGDLDSKILPQEYGGVTPITEMIDLFKKELVANQSKILQNDETMINLEMYSARAREGSVRALSEGFDQPQENDAYGIEGSFRKLEVD